MPIEIQAVAEGSVIPTNNVLVQIINTDPKLPWLSSYIETALLRAIWYPSSVATVSWHVKQKIRKYLEETADNVDSLPFKLHDFGARGASSEQTAALGGAAHLVNFSGSDTISGILAARRYYGEAMAGFSIPAAEHSTITAWGKAGEEAAYANMLKQFGGSGKILAVVSDSYDLWQSIDKLWGDKLKQILIDNGACVVIRPDSGDPVSVVTHAVSQLMKKFGYSINSKGYKVLPPYLRLIQGDGVNPDSIKAILKALKLNGLSAENVAFGMGGALLQKADRDTLKFAMKASAVEINGEWIDIYKDPVTDSGKRSKKGRLALIQNELGKYETIREQALGTQDNLLVSTYRNGELLVDWSFSEIRDRATQAKLDTRVFNGN